MRKIEGCLRDKEGKKGALRKTNSNRHYLFSLPPRKFMSLSILAFCPSFSLLMTLIMRLFSLFLSFSFSLSLFLSFSLSLFLSFSLSLFLSFSLSLFLSFSLSLFLSFSLSLFLSFSLLSLSLFLFLLS